MIAASVCWSLGGLLIRFVPEAWGGMSIVGVRAFLAAIVFIIWRRDVKVKLTKGNILGAVCLSANTALFVFANLLTTAAAAILLQFSAPVFIILIHFVFYQIKPKLSEVLAAAITILGMLLFFVDRLETGGALGNVLAIIAGLAFAGVFVCNKRPDAQPEQSLLLSFYISSVIGLPFVFLHVTADLVGWGSVVVLGIVQVGLAYVFFSQGIKKTSALLACLITALEPILNPLWVGLVTGEIPGRFSIAGGIIIVLTVVIYNIWSARDNDKKNPPLT